MGCLQEIFSSAKALSGVLYKNLCGWNEDRPTSLHTRNVHTRKKPDCRQDRTKEEPIASILFASFVDKRNKCLFTYSKRCRKLTTGTGLATADTFHVSHVFIEIYITSLRSG